MRFLRITLLACFCLCCGRAGLAQAVYGSTTLDIDADSVTVTATCETDADDFVAEYYKVRVNCVVEDSNYNIVAGGSGSDDSGQGYVQAVVTFTGVPGETYTATSFHSVFEVYTVEYYDGEDPQPIFLGYDDMYDFGFYSENPQTYDDYFEWDSPGPETATRSRTQHSGNTQAKKTVPQIPTSLKVLSVGLVADGSTPGAGCDPQKGIYGIAVDIKYQVLDQAGQPILRNDMTPMEVVSGVNGPTGPNNIGPTGNSNSTLTTASDGTFHDVPFLMCSNGPFQNQTILQIIYINNVNTKVRQNAFNGSSSASDHGSISNGSDISASR